MPGQALPGQAISHVFCLSPDQQGHLVDAAIVLNLAKRGATHALQVTKPDLTTQELTIDEWRADHGADFDRACQAVVGAAQVPLAAQNPKTSTTPSVWAVLLPVIVGALIAGLNTLWRDSTAHGRQLAGALSAARDEFVEAGTTYATQWADPKQGGRPPDQDLRKSRDRLTAKLSEVVHARPTWSVPHQLLSQLSSGSLGEQLARTFTDADDQALPDTAESVKKELSELRTRITKVARALEQPGLPHRAMRKPDNAENRRQPPA